MPHVVLSESPHSSSLFKTTSLLTPVSSNLPSDGCCALQLRILQKLPTMRPLCAQLQGDNTSTPVPATSLPLRQSDPAGVGAVMVASEAFGVMEEEKEEEGRSGLAVCDFSCVGLERTRRRQRWQAARTDATAAATLLAMAERRARGRAEAASVRALAAAAARQEQVRGAPCMGELVAHRVAEREGMRC